MLILTRQRMQSTGRQLQRLRLVKDPKWRADEQPAAFTESIFVGSARHAEDLSTLRSLGVTAVLNLAPGACDDPEDLFEDNGIAYLELDAEDFVGYPLFEMHLEAATAFVEQLCLPLGGKVLIHCFAGVNRSAAIAVAIIMLSGRKPLYEVVQACFERRPFILSNASFRQQLVQLAAETTCYPIQMAMHATMNEGRVVRGGRRRAHPSRRTRKRLHDHTTWLQCFLRGGVVFVGRQGLRDTLRQYFICTCFIHRSFISHSNTSPLCLCFPVQVSWGTRIY